MSVERNQSRISSTRSPIQLRKRQRVARVLADEARRARDAVRDDVGAEAAGELDCLRAALHRRGQPAFGVGEGNRHLLVGTARLDDVAVLRQRVLAERDLQLRDRDRDHRDAGHRLGRLRVRREVDVTVQAERLAPRGDRGGVVLAG